MLASATAVARELSKRSMVEGRPVSGVELFQRRLVNSSSAARWRLRSQHLPAVREESRRFALMRSLYIGQCPVLALAYFSLISRLRSACPLALWSPSRTKAPVRAFSCESLLCSSPYRVIFLHSPTERQQPRAATGLGAHFTRRACQTMRASRRTGMDLECQILAHRQAEDIARKQPSRLQESPPGYCRRSSSCSSSARRKAISIKPHGRS